MKQRTIENKDQLNKAVHDLAQLEASMPFVITLTEGKRIRSNSQNARYWANVTQFMEDIKHTVQRISEYTGYTELETKRLIASALEPEQVAILYARRRDSVHDVLKDICNIPTSTRLGTKDFMKFEVILEKTMTETLGCIHAVAQQAGV